MTTGCSIDGCTRPVYKRGWCGAHFGRWERHGDPFAGQGTEKYLTDRIKFGGPTDCWPYQEGTPTRSGHLLISWHGRKRLVHRVIYELKVAPIPDGMLVMHRCDNPPCVNWTNHLRLGTVRENNLDRDLKGRHVALAGSRNGSSKLSEWQVHEIRAACRAGQPQRRVANRYGVSQGLVSLIMRGKAWSHVPDLEHLTAPVPTGDH